MSSHQTLLHGHDKGKARRVDKEARKSATHRPSQPISRETQPFSLLCCRGEAPPTALEWSLGFREHCEDNSEDESTTTSEPDSETVFEWDVVDLYKISLLLLRYGHDTCGPVLRIFVCSVIEPWRKVECFLDKRTILLAGPLLTDAETDEITLAVEVQETRVINAVPWLRREIRRLNAKLIEKSETLRKNANGYTGSLETPQKWVVDTSKCKPLPRTSKPKAEEKPTSHVLKYTSFAPFVSGERPNELQDNVAPAAETHLTAAKPCTGAKYTSSGTSPGSQWKQDPVVAEKCTTGPVSPRDKNVVQTGKGKLQLDGAFTYAGTQRTSGSAAAITLETPRHISAQEETSRGKQELRTYWADRILRESETWHKPRPSMAAMAKIVAPKQADEFVRAKSSAREVAAANAVATIADGAAMQEAKGPAKEKLQHHRPPIRDADPNSNTAVTCTSTNSSSSSNGAEENAKLNAVLIDRAADAAIVKRQRNRMAKERETHSASNSVSGEVAMSAAVDASTDATAEVVSRVSSQEDSESDAEQDEQDAQEWVDVPGEGVERLDDWEGVDAEPEAERRLGKWVNVFAKVERGWWL
ncbi:hypothetical protein LTR62_007787 [Meristemomyces frigidus]|uniref:Uncharacterized protein n=1 Tax=Meristemomyces frigidus TaxID=1508187 RepID=A0AAN7TAD4_9PEZI|nr:hypothetical protein LTR62_007787 [Meristemomyces frigidus]